MRRIGGERARVQARLGYGFIDEMPFNEPPPGGALLPTTQAYPRGYIRDTLIDGKDVRLTVYAFTPGNPHAAAQYHVNEGDFKNISIDRRLDISPFQMSYLRYDFCRFDPSSGAVEVCDTIYRIGRPSPAPAPTPTPTPKPAPAPLPPTDADGDGFPVPADCWDQNATVHPGATEIPGNGYDDDCAGGDAPARLAATIWSKWGISDHRLRPRITIDVTVSYPNTIGKVARFPIKRVAVPDMLRLCLPPGAKKPSRC